MTALPPLVDPGAPLTEAELTRYSRHVLLAQVSEMGQRRLKAARVLVIGAGGLGAPSLQYLAAAGVGTVGIIDDDDVDETNLQRQVIHRTSDIGIPKVDSAHRAITELNPLVTVRTHRTRLTEANARQIFADYDLILDGADNFPTRYLVNDAAAELNIPLVWASVLGFDAQLSVFWARPPAGPGVTLRDLFPRPPAEGTVPSCSQAGVVGAMVGQVGSAMAAEAIKLIIGIGQVPLGQVLVLDQLRSTWTALPLRPRRPGSRSSPAPDEPAPVEETSSAAPADEQWAWTDTVLPGHRLIDVRDADEVAAGAIPGADHIPLVRLLTEPGRADLDPRSPVLVYCQVGPRAERAAQELTSCGFSVTILRGGYEHWARTQERRAG